MWVFGIGMGSFYNFIFYNFIISILIFVSAGARGYVVGMAIWRGEGAGSHKTATTSRMMLPTTVTTPAIWCACQPPSRPRVCLDFMNASRWVWRTIHITNMSTHYLGQGNHVISSCFQLPRQQDKAMYFKYTKRKREQAIVQHAWSRVQIKFTIL